MWKPEREVVCLVLVATFTIATLVSAVEETVHKNRECNSTDLDKRICNETERCAFDEETRKYSCICLRDHVREMSSGKCIKRPPTISPSPETTTEKLDDTHRSSGSSVALGLLVPTFLIGLGVLGFCIARRYRLLPSRRNLYGNVLVTRDDDDDDPPIADIVCEKRKIADQREDGRRNT